AVHGAALERILELVSESGETGETIIRKCGQDELVSGLLLLYSLHPEDMHSRVMRALEKSRSYLASHAAHAELISIGDDGTVTVSLQLKANGCGSSSAQVKSTLEAALQNAAPDAASIVVEESGVAIPGAGFVSVAELQSGKRMAVLSAARVQVSGD
ncbi:MAG: NifU family protein, partial [Candidatus Acidiferrales bacterium]